MKILAVLENIPQNKFSYHYGRYVLNSNFLLALMTYSSFDEIHFFVDNLGEGKKDLASLRLKPFYKKIKIFPIYIFTEQLRSNLYTAIHTNMFMLLRGIASIRNKIDPTVPITALTATIAYPFYDSEFLSITSLLNDKDAIVAPSVNSCTYIDKMCNEVIRQSEDPSLKRKFEIEKIPYGINIPVLPELSPEKSLKELSVLIFNRFSKYDKCDLLPILRLLKQVIGSVNQKIQFVIAGDSSDSVYLKTIIKEIKSLKIEKNIKLVISPSEKRKNELLKSADIFLALSDNIQESFGIVLLEAMSYGLPIIATEWDGYKDLVKEGENGMCVKTFKLEKSEEYFFKQRNLSIFPFSHALTYWKYDTYLNSQITFIDNQSFMEKIIKLIENKSLRNKLSAGALEKVQQFSWEKVIKSYEDLWLKLYSKKASVIMQKDTFCVGEHILDSFYSQILEGAVVRLVKHEIQKVDLKRVVSNYSDLKGLLDEGLLWIVICELRKGSQFVDELVKKMIFPAGMVRFNISWLLKNNFIILTK